MGKVSFERLKISCSIELIEIQKSLDIRYVERRQNKPIISFGIHSKHIKFVCAKNINAVSRFNAVTFDCIGNCVIKQCSTMNAANDVCQPFMILLCHKTGTSAHKTICLPFVCTKSSSTTSIGPEMCVPACYYPNTCNHKIEL